MIRVQEITIVGRNLPDPFYDSYREEAFACADIIDSIGRTEGKFVNVTFDKSFLKKLVHSHLVFIRRIEIANGHQTPR